MLAFIGSLVVFLREIFLAVTSTRNFVHLKAVRNDSKEPSPAGYRPDIKPRVPSSEDLGK